jgi:apolipoprotein N-acyltransferase
VTFLCRVTQTAQYVRLSYGWRRAAIAFFAGAASALALAPINAWPILFLTFPILIWLIDGAAKGRWGRAFAAGWAGWCFGFGYFVFGLYWIGYAFLVDAKTFAWLLPFAITGLPAYLAIYTGLGVAAARLMWVRGPTRVLALAATLALAEWLRGHLLSGFPWNAFGYALTEPLALAQAVSLIGIWGLTFVVVAIFASPAVIADDKNDTPYPFRPLIVATFVMVFFACYGTFRLWTQPTEYVDGVKLRILQPNLQQDDKFNYGAKARVMAHYLNLSGQTGAQKTTGLSEITHLIWPEAAFPFFLTREPDALAQIAALLKPNTQLITGAVRAANSPAGARITRAYNSLYVIDPDGSIRNVYDKVHLVPFGEYLPFQTFLEKLGLQQITKQTGGFLAGTRRRAMNVTNAPSMLPLICYEAIFPDAAASGERADWLVNVTNDGWFGISSGPYQHLQQARVLAIAQGVPLVRAANTGVSAVIDPVGRIISILPLEVEGAIDSHLPRAIMPTTYVKLGDWIFFALEAIALIIVGCRRFVFNRI